MRRRSVSGPLLLLLIGAFFLWRNLHPEAPIFDLVAQYWPFALIAWGLLRLLEVLAFSERGSTFTGGEVVLVVLICLVGTGMWAGHQHGLHYDLGGLNLGESYDYPASAQAPAAGVTRLTVENPRGSIKVTGADTEQILVTAHKSIQAWSRDDAERTNSQTPLEIVPEGDRLLLRTNQDHAPENQRVSDDLEVTVPRGMTVEARARSGDIEMNDIGGDVEIVSDHADVRLSGIGGNGRVEVGHSDVIRVVDVKGRVDVHGRGSDVDVENVAGQVTIAGSYSGALEFKNLARPLQFEGTLNTELHAQAVPGRLNMDRGEVTGTGLTGPVRLVTRSRDIRLAQFTKSLDLQTEHGDVQLAPASPMPAIEARSGFGKIELVLPDKAAFDLQATAERGEATNDFGPPIEKQVDGRTMTLKGKVGDGPTIRITANRGSVEVRKEGQAASEDEDEVRGNHPKPPRPPAPPAEVKM